MNLRIRTLVVFAAGLLTAAFADAATFSVLCDGSFDPAQRGCSIKLSGRIIEGDADRLRATIREPLLDRWHYHTLLLDSPGGSVLAAIEVAKVVRQAILDTTTFRLTKRTGQPSRPERWKCVSACFLVWVAGANRDAFTSAVVPGQTSDIGLHRPYLDRSAYANAPQAVAAMQQEMTRATAEYLQQEQVPRALIEKMLQQASTEIYWLGPDDPDITGRAPWFEEMMIARCEYDPGYDRESTAWGMQQILKGRKADLESQNANYAKYLAWKQRYNACEYSVREVSQAAMRK